MSDLEQYRRQIDAIDHQIVHLLADRMKIVKQVGIYKKQNNMPPLQPERWQQVLSDKQQKAKNAGLSPELITDIYNTIHKYALQLEED